MEVIYPFPKKLQPVTKGMNTGNFGLWYNKFIPLSNVFEAADDRGNDTRAVEFYFERYGQLKKGEIAGLLKQKHDDQDTYCDSFPPVSFEVIRIEATLASPFLTGIGESHPNEVSMIFDHNLGIPYIPASGVKGIVRFAHTVSLIPEALQRGKIDEKGRFDDEEDWTFILNMFGARKKKGDVIFLDAYPQLVPQLHIDIMNPHYGPYYSDGLPPADHHNPTPIKFLTVATGTSFIFRAIARKDKEFPRRVRGAFSKALTEEGIGAKTAVGYGRFEIASGEKMTAEKPAAASPPVEEIWENAFVSFNAGGGGIVTAQSQDKKTAEIRGKEKAVAATDASLHKKLFEGKKTLPKVRVTVRKTGNNWQIVKIEPAA